ncbi:hypothetical protein GCM10023196_049500 [Actinoallomurus vinaceus]|uniref:Peptidase inhibitor family I36 n=2 Tax=Actinoallomurus vinaceus TaxID=1080074 RepID=A0ABP8UEI2_9ACTN
MFTLPRSTSAMKAALAATIVAGTLLVTGGVANAATYFGPAQACRGATPPGLYPEDVQLDPCFDSTEEHGRWFFTGAGFSSPYTDIDVYTQVGWKPRGADGNPVPGEPYWGGRVVFWGDVTGIHTPIYDVNENDGIGISPGYCFYNKIWFTDNGKSYGPAESPGDCF